MQIFTGPWPKYYFHSEKTHGETNNMTEEYYSWKGDFLQMNVFLLSTSV